MQVIHRREGFGWTSVQVGEEVRRLEAVEAALLLFLVAVIELGHAGFEVCTLGLDAETGVALFLDCLQRVTRHAALLLEGIELLFETRALLLPVVDLIFGLLAGRFQVGKSIFQGSGQLLLCKEVLLDRADTSFLVLDQLRLSNVLALVTRSGR